MFIPPQLPTLPTQKPPQISNFGSFGPIWMKLGGEVYIRVSNSISAYGMVGGTFSPPQPHVPTQKLVTFHNRIFSKRFEL